jgi:hypothetical protein
VLAVVLIGLVLLVTWWEAVLLAIATLVAIAIILSPLAE